MTNSTKQSTWFTPELDIEKANKKELIEYLDKHFRYYTMNSWNRSTSYANNVKVTKLDLSSRFGNDIANRALSIVCDSEINDIEFQNDINKIIKDFQDETRYTMSSNGRSSGYLVMYETQQDDNGKLCALPGKEIDFLAECDPKYLDTEELRDYAHTLKAFDMACDRIVNKFMEYVIEGELVEYTDVVIVNKKRLTLNDDPKECDE